MPLAAVLAEGKILVLAEGKFLIERKPRSTVLHGSSMGVYFSVFYIK